MPQTDWATLVNWLISGFIGLGFGTIGAWMAHHFQRQRDDVAWERERSKLQEQWKHDTELLERQFEQRLKELDLQTQQEESKRLRAELTKGLDKTKETIKDLEDTRILIARQAALTDQVSQVEKERRQDEFYIQALDVLRNSAASLGSYTNTLTRLSEMLSKHLEERRQLEQERLKIVQALTIKSQEQGNVHLSDNAA